LSVINIIKFKKICDFLGIETEAKEDFTKRLVLQKLFYFIQKLGIDLDIKYNFYKYGPYSPDLTDIYYSVMNLTKQEFNYFPDITFTKQERIIIDKLNNIYKKWGNDIDKLEFYASVLYIYKDMYIKNTDKEGVKKVVNKLKPKLFSKFNFEEVLEELKFQGFLNLC